MSTAWTLSAEAELKAKDNVNAFEGQLHSETYSSELNPAEKKSSDTMKQQGESATAWKKMVFNQRLQSQDKQQK